MKLTPLKAIRAKCLDCSAGSKSGVKNCPSRICPLWMYRFGKLAPKTPAFTHRKTQDDRVLKEVET